MKTLYIDIETEGLNPFKDSTAICQVFDGGVVRIFQGEEDIRALKPWFEGSMVVGHNLSFDLKFLKHQFDISPNNVYDTMIAEIVISGGLFAGQSGVVGLKDLSKRYLGLEMDKTEQTTFRIGQPLTPEQIEYAALDVTVLQPIYQAQQEKIQKLNLKETIDIEMQCLPGTVWLNLSGMRIDLEGLHTFRDKMVERRDNLKRMILDMVGEHEGHKIASMNDENYDSINLNSPAQLKTTLKKLGISCKSTAAEELKKIDHPIAKLICEYREAEKMLNTFIDKIPGFVDTSSRIHADFRQLGTSSGRFSCSNPNLQNQPHEPVWRTLFRAGRGRKIVTADYSQIELRILGEVSGDSAFIEAYRNGQDLHKLTAAKVLGKQEDAVTKEERQIAKKVNFGTVYGQECIGLKKSLEEEGIKITEREADTFIQGFYSSYPKVKEYIYSVQDIGLAQLELRNKAGRLYKFEKPRNNSERGEIKRKCRNLPIQGLCADMIKVAIGNLYRILEPMGVKFVNCVHDELVFECGEDQVEEVAKIVKQEMEAAGKRFMCQVPCIAEVTISDSWSK